MADKAKAQHSWDIKAKAMRDQHQPACLTSHARHYADSNTCSYRGQARTKAAAEPHPKVPGANRYDWPAGVKGPSARDPKAWNIERKDNFRRRSRVPWWHEAHHIVPFAELTFAIKSVGEASSAEYTIVRAVRLGLLEEGYNLNDKLNMILLPQDRKAYRAVRLPLHRKTKSLRSHKAYSAHVKKKLLKFFEKMKREAEGCDPKEFTYQSCRKQIEKLSKALYPAIRDSEAESVAEMFTAPAPASSVFG